MSSNITPGLLIILELVCLLSIAAQREFPKMLTTGAEIFNTSPKTKGETDETGFNAGGLLNLGENHHILFSVGREFKGPNTLFAILVFSGHLFPGKRKRQSN